MTAFFRLINSFFDSVLELVEDHRWRVIYRIVIASLVLIASSLVLPYSLVAVVAIVSCYFLYYAMAPVQDQLFQYTRDEIYWYIATPCYTLFILWGYLVLLFDREALVGYLVGNHFILAVVTIWPVFRRKKNFDKTQRDIPFIAVYGTVGILFVILQCYVFWRFL